MPLALVDVNALLVMRTTDDVSMNINIPGLWQVQGVTAGYFTPDNLFAVVSFTHFVPPAGKIITGSPSYDVSVELLVTETYSVVDTPPFITNLVFRGLFTPAERLAIATASLSDGQLRLFIDDYLVNPIVDLTAEPVTTGCAYLVSLNLMTQERVDEILAYRNP